MSLTSIWYDGELKGKAQVPIAGAMSTGLDMKVSYTMANFTHVWDTGKGRWNYASAIGVPVQYTDITASITGPRGRTLGTEDTATQFADMLVTPIAAGYHVDEVNHFSFSLPIYVPTGAYNDNRLANAGQNTYTFMPTVAFTHLDGKGGEFTLSSGLEIYTENDATDYQERQHFYPRCAVDPRLRQRLECRHGGGLHPAGHRRLGQWRHQRLPRPLGGGRPDHRLGRQVQRCPGQRQRALGAGVRHQEPA